MSFRFVFSLLATASLGTAATAQDLGFRVPPGFEISQYAGDELAHDIFSMTLDAQGHVIVAGRGYVKRLHDEDGDGKADRATLFANVPKTGAQGMFFDGPDLICTGDNSLMRLRDRNHDGKADDPPELIARLRHDGHAANGVVQGPDGWFYVSCGNDAGVFSRLATTPGSPVKKPQCGAIVRFSPDGKQSEIIAHGFRNPYDLAFNRQGHLFTVDADGERDQYMPWYTPDRLFDIAQGMHHGWILRGWKRSWNRPESYFDNVERLVEIGRGSPTGVIVYRHHQFPQRYRGGVMSLCWTLGRVYFFPLAPRGSGYESRREIFLETTGDVGFAPVDLAVGPAGDLFIAIGGRGTRGSVFRVHYVGEPQSEPPQKENNPLLQVLDATQPLTSWSRAHWVPLARQLGAKPLVSAVVDEKRTLPQRIRAIEVLVEMFGGVPPGLLPDDLAERHPELAARFAWALGRSRPSDVAFARLRQLTTLDDQRTRRAAWEAIAAWPADNDAVSDSVKQWTPPEITKLEDRRTRATRLLAEARWIKSAPAADNLQKLASGQMLDALWRLHFQRQLKVDHFAVTADLFTKLSTANERLQAVRLMFITLGDVRGALSDPDVYAGYRCSAAESLTNDDRRRADRLVEAFPTGDAELDRELARLLAILEISNDTLPERLSLKWNQESSVQDDIHYLIVLSRLSGKRSDGTTQRTAKALALLHHKMAAAQMHPSRNWPTRVGETFTKLSQHDPQLAQSLVTDARFGLPQHSMFAALMPDDQRLAAVRQMLRYIESSDDEVPWTSQFVKMLGQLPAEESLPRLRELWDEPGLRDDIALVLADHPQPEDRELLVEALASVQPQVVEQVARALRKFEGPTTEAELLVAMKALRHACGSKPYLYTRTAITRLMTSWTHQQYRIREVGAEDLMKIYKPWFDWFDETYPRSSKQLSGFGNIDVADWDKRLEAINWDAGNADRGKAVFQRQSCHKCHLGNSRLGPELSGVTSRLSRKDLFVAVLNPSKDVSPLYQSTQLITGSGKVYQGLVVYQSPDGTLLQTTPDTTIRVAGTEIVSLRKSRQSIMPTGLLNGIKDQELADLYAFLKTLRRGQ